jgi:hypothetical protein
MLVNLATLLRFRVDTLWLVGSGAVTGLVHFVLK